MLIALVICVCVAWIAGTGLFVLIHRRPLAAQWLKRLMNPLARPAYEQRVRQAIDRYDAEEREIEAKIQSIEHEPIPVIALHEVNEQTFGVGADGELVELDRMLAEDSNESNETFKEDI